MLKKILLATAISISTTILWASSARAEKCAIYTEGLPSIMTYAYSNCPFPNGGGIFQNDLEKIHIAHLGGDSPHYRFGLRVPSGRYFVLVGFDIRGTTDRRQYFFNSPYQLNDPYTHIVTIRPSNPNIIRVEMYEGNKLISNKLFYRIGSSEQAERALEEMY